MQLLTDSALQVEQELAILRGVSHDAIVRIVDCNIDAAASSNFAVVLTEAARCSTSTVTMPDLPRAAANGFSPS